MIETNMPTVEPARLSTPKKRKQREMYARFPATMNFGITMPMAIALGELSKRGSHKTQSDIARDALHFYLLNIYPRFQQLIDSATASENNGK